MDVSEILAILRGELQALRRRSSFRDAWTRGRRSAAFDAAVALAALGSELTNVVGTSGGSPAPIVLATLAGISVVGRRVAPLGVLLCTGATAIVTAAIGSELSGLSAFVALYAVTVAYDRRISLAVGLAPTATISAVLTAAGAESGKRALSVGIDLGVVCAIWVAGTYVQMRRRYLRALEERAADAERERDQLNRLAVQEERAAIARELHDIVAHSVGVMLVGVRGARDVLYKAPDVAEETLARVETSGEQSVAELRRILALLRTSGNGPGSRPQPSIAQLEELVAGYRQAGVPVRLEIAGRPLPLPGGVELSVYRIVEEALTNVLKHSRPSQVTVTLAYDTRQLEVEVVNDGRAEEQMETGPPGHGIVGMRERVALLGGEFEAGRRLGSGFRVVARLPIAGEP